MTGSVQFWDIFVSCQAGMLTMIFLAPFQQHRCVCIYPPLAPLSLVLIPVLGFILQPRWFQGVSCCLVNPCPALSCRNLPQQLGCGGNLLREVPGCSPLQARGQDQGHQLGTGGRSTPGFILSGYKKKNNPLKVKAFVEAKLFFLEFNKELVCVN